MRWTCQFHIALQSNDSSKIVGFFFFFAHVINAMELWSMGFFVSMNELLLVLLLEIWLNFILKSTNSEHTTFVRCYNKCKICQYSNTTHV